jgi:hypothetical protein
MDARSKNLFRDKLDARNFEPSSKKKNGQKGKTFHYERGNYVQSGIRQQNAQMFDHLINIYCFKGAA